jgi:hypothetical protein
VGQLRRLAANLALVVVTVGLCLLLLEGTFRLFPRLLPAGVYGASRFDPGLGMSVHGSDVVYNKVRFVVRKPNAEGFLDVDHDRAKQPGVVRIAFFGDSFVEAIQVPFGQVFYRLLPDRIADQPVEPLGFGMSGWGTLHSFLAYESKAGLYDVDTCVYVFFENDPGDNMYDVKGARASSSNMVFAKLSPHPPGFELVRRIPFEEQGGALGVAKRVQQRSVLARMLWSRGSLLIGRGPAVHADPHGTEMAARAGRVPDQNDLPSTWPVPLRERAEELGRRILSAWRDRARRDGRGLIVLYVPRGEAQLRGEFAPADTWRPWLLSATRDLGIPLIDPSDALERRLEDGDRVYDDHWAPAGHEVIADVLEQFLANELRVALRLGSERTRSADLKAARGEGLDPASRRRQAATRRTERARDSRPRGTRPRPPAPRAPGRR